MPDGFEIQYPEEKCHVCGKTQADLMVFREELLAKHQGILEAAEQKLEIQKKKVEEVLQGGIPENFLSFKLETILHDPENFKNMIPNLGILLPYERHYQMSRSRQDTLADFITWLKENPEQILESQDIKYTMNEIRRAQKEFDRLWNGETMDISLHRKKVGMRMPGGTSFIVLICPVCDALFKEASIAAYRKRDDD